MNIFRSYLFIRVQLTISRLAGFNAMLQVAETQLVLITLERKGCVALVASRCIFDVAAHATVLSQRRATVRGGLRLQCLLPWLLVSLW